MHSSIRAGSCLERGMVCPEDLAKIEKVFVRFLTSRSLGKFLDFTRDWSSRRSCLQVSHVLESRCPKSYVARGLHRTRVTWRVKNWYDEKAFENVSAPQINSACAMSSEPEATQQSLHRDDGNYHNQLPATQQKSILSVGICLSYCSWLERRSCKRTEPCALCSAFILKA